MCNVLAKAAYEKVFILWALVFADAGITGLEASRQVYRSLKEALELYATVDVVFIDEFSRASRDTLE